jgi:beta-glucanase (GH16 family)
MKLQSHESKRLNEQMKKPCSSILIFVFSFSQLTSAQNYQVVWSDEFNGTLVITALKEEYGGRHDTSARLSTQLSWQYGRIEARMKLPFGQGLWPAFGTLGANINSIGWPACGQIDIIEMIGGSSRSNPSGGDD